MVHGEELVFKKGETRGRGRGRREDGEAQMEAAGDGNLRERKKGTN